MHNIAAINVICRLIQDAGAEVIHLGHDRSAKEVVDCAVRRDARCGSTSIKEVTWNISLTLDNYSMRAECAHIKILVGEAEPLRPLK